jgi:hypothetical protein
MENNFQIGSFYNREYPMETKYIVHSARFYGQPKLTKPKELSKIKQECSIYWIHKKCTCPLFINGKDVWLKHRDYYSNSMIYDKEDSGASLGFLAKKYLDKDRGNKFIYGDAWGDIVCRNEAWLKLENLMLDIKNCTTEGYQLDIKDRICREIEISQHLEEYAIYPEVERFYERVVKYLYKRQQS